MNSIIDRTKHKIEVMQAFVDGKPIQVMRRDNLWEDCKSPGWNWGHVDYRIAPLEKPSIDWSQIPEQYRWLAVDASGNAYLFDEKEPVKGEIKWFAAHEYSRVDHIHISYKRGTVDWRDSLVERV